MREWGQYEGVGGEVNLEAELIIDMETANSINLAQHTFYEQIFDISNQGSYRSLVSDPSN